MPEMFCKMDLFNLFVKSLRLDKSFKDPIKLNLKGALCSHSDRQTALCYSLSSEKQMIHIEANASKICHQMGKTFCLELQPVQSRMRWNTTHVSDNRGVTL